MKKLYALFTFTITITFTFSQGTWTQKANFAGTARQYGTGFSIGTKGYVSCGLNCTTTACYQADLWEWDQNTNTWAQKAVFPGAARRALVSFVVGTKGYLSCGYDLNGNYLKDLWEWDQTGNTWTQKAVFPGTAREDATAFSVGTKGYVGCGKSPGPKIDWYEYDPGGNTWMARANFAGTGKYAAVGFSIGTKGYHCTGFQGGAMPYVGDLWEFDPVGNSWTQKATLPGDPRIYATGFAMNGKGYVACGYNSPTYGGQGVYNDFWEWDQSSNTWAQQASIPANTRAYAMGFAIGNKGYVTQGGNAPNQAGTWNDLWEWAPNITTSVGELSENAFSIYPNPSADAVNVNVSLKGILQVFNAMGERVENREIVRGNDRVDVSAYAKGVYFFSFRCEEGFLVKKVVVK